MGSELDLADEVELDPADMTEEQLETYELFQELDDLEEGQRISGNDINYNALENLSEDEWEELVEENINP
jgi:hypothetical protein